MKASLWVVSGLICASLIGAWTALFGGEDWREWLDVVKRLLLSIILLVVGLAAAFALFIGIIWADSEISPYFLPGSATVLFFVSVFGIYRWLGGK